MQHLRGAATPTAEIENASIGHAIGKTHIEGGSLAGQQMRRYSESRDRLGAVPVGIGRSLADVVQASPGNGNSRRHRIIQQSRLELLSLPEKSARRTLS